MNVGFIHLGCSKNLVDTEMAIGLFKQIINIALLSQKITVFVEETTLHRCPLLPVQLS